MSIENPVPLQTTLRIKERCLCLATQRAARMLARRFDEAFRQIGLTNQQFSLMMSLNRPAPPTMGMTSKFLAMDRTTLTAALKPLEKRGLVAVQPDPKDKRGRLLSLTPSGHQLLLQALPIWERTLGEIEAPLAGLDLQAMRSGLWALA